VVLVVLTVQFLDHREILERQAALVGQAEFPELEVIKDLVDHLDHKVTKVLQVA
jgi:hypothetical protein